MGKHTFYTCPPECDNPHCNFCQGGLSFCTVCRCGEGDLPSKCPGEPVGENIRDQIYNSALDFIGGKWKTKIDKGGWDE